MAHRSIPSEMRAVVLSAYGAEPTLACATRPVPKPAAGEVLVRLSASPINPSDLAFVKGLYGFKKQLPTVPGFEGSGVVVASGGGLAARALINRRVACVASERADGTWADYMVAPLAQVVPLLPSVDQEQGSMLFVNPLTAYALLEIAEQGKHRAIVQTAAASQLGRMILRLAQRRGLAMIHVVRRQAQVDILRALGAEHVLDSSEPDFDKRLGELSRRLGASLALDAVAGEMTARVAAALPRGGRVLVYGALSEAACQVTPGDLIFADKHLEGFWLSTWLRRQTLTTVAKAGLSVQRHLATDFRSAVRARFPLDRAVEALALYAAEMTKGKVLFVP